ncbi:MAG: 2-oxoacid:acceptor oxidoreductase subunit alpha [Candidatus Moraniibacteriota bacterium]
MKHFSKDISIVIGGAAGQGVQTVETMLMTVLKSEGYQVFSSKEYMSRIRGGSNSTEIRITNTGTRSYTRHIDILFALDGAVIPHLEDRITKKTVILGEKGVVKSEHHVIDVPLSKMTDEIGSPIYAGTIAVGVILGFLKAPKGPFESFLRSRFMRKGDEVVQKNLTAAEKGYSLGEHLAYAESIDITLNKNDDLKKKLMLSGDQALGLGVLVAGCNFISSYPMSPGTGLLTFLAEQGGSLGVVVDQAEDEIAAINMCLGAWYAGARAIVTTSGGGFALMCEGVSLAGMIETPAVIHIGMRPGPATGLPTRTEQGDLNLVLYSGHGEFPRAMFVPGDQEEAFLCAQQAFEMANKYQSPVFILTDQYLLDSVALVDEADLKRLPINAHIVEMKDEYKRYSLETKDGVSPRGVPGYGSGIVSVDSDEHDEAGHITESFDLRQKMMDKRLQKLEGLTTEALAPTFLGDMKEYETLLVCFGSTKGVVTELVNRGEKTVAMLHFSQVYPLAPDAKKYFKRGKHIVVIENNATGQFADLLEKELKVKIDQRILKYIGEPFSCEEIAREISNS